MTVGQQTDEKPVDEVVLADDHPAHFLLERTHPGGGLPHGFGDGLNPGVLARPHGCRRRAGRPASAERSMGLYFSSSESMTGAGRAIFEGS